MNTIRLYITVYYFKTFYIYIYIYIYSFYYSIDVKLWTSRIEVKVFEKYFCGI